MRPRSLVRLFTASLMVFGALFISGGFLLWSSTPQIFNQLIYNPYPPGILPPNLNSEIARVLREIDVVEARAIARWHSLPPPTRLPVRPGPNPPVLQGSGTESIETLGELMLFDKNMSPGRNQACTSCHMPYAGWSGPIPSVNATIIAYPGAVPLSAPASGRRSDTHMHRSSLCCNTTKNRAYSLVGISGIHARPDIGYEIPTPNRHRVLRLILKKWASLTLLAWRFGFSSLYTVLSSN